VSAPPTREAIVAALARGGVIDITTSGRRTGLPRRIEIDFFPIDGGIYISGSPGRRDWMANLHADPRLTFHLKGAVEADLPATARIVTDAAERRPLLEHVTRAWGQQARLRAYTDGAPLIEVTFDDPALVAA
jgi:deazaflavin-dependent oxidoreductase (nitroreductase family)